MVKSISEIRKIAKEYKDVLKRYDIRVTKLILYGSYAKGTPKSYSDIDLIVVSPDLARFSPLKDKNYLRN